MINKFFNRILLSLIFLTGTIYAGDIKVNYISAENVYIDAGISAGVDVGSILIVQKNGQEIARLEVIYASEHSASCKILSKISEIKKGAPVDILSQPSKDIIPEVTTATLTTTVETDKQDIIKKDPVRIRGYLAFQWYTFKNKGSGNYNFDQPALRLKLKGERLFNQHIYLDMHVRARYYKRFSRTPETEWRNRLYSFNISYSNPNTPISLSLGRLISGKFSGVGYIDGLQLNYIFNAKWNWGIFAGFKPGWKTSDFQTEEKKYGLFVDFQSVNDSGLKITASVAGAGEYHGTTISREFVYIRSGLISGSKWNIYHSMEIDINRGWRKERSGSTLSLSSLYLSGYFKVNNFWSAQLTYDNRRNYYYYEYISIADSLFDDAFRQGLRMKVNFNPDKNIYLYVSGGIRKRIDDSQTTYSYYLGCNVRRLIFNGFSGNIRGGMFSNLYTMGQNYSLKLSQRINPAHYISVIYGQQIYHLNLNNDKFNNQWIRVDTGFNLPLDLFLSLFYEYDFGDDLEGQRMFAELGYRF